MSEADLKKEIKQIIMLISSIRSKDNEQYEEHVKFSNEVVDFIRKIADDVNDHFQKIETSLASLKQGIDDSLDTLLTGINPEGIKETSNSLKEIMSTMSKSMQSMNLENVMRELRVLTGGEVTFNVPERTVSASTSKAIPLKTSASTPYSSAQPGAQSTSQAKASGPTEAQKAVAAGEGAAGFTAEELEEIKAAYGGELPPHIKEQIEGKKEDQGLLKPSDFFGM